MKQLLVRAGMSPFDTFDPAHMLVHNSIGSNVGNLVYQYSVFRALMTRGTTLVPNHYRVDPAEADRISEEYDALVIPLADAFRTDFIPELRRYTKLIKRLTIPVVVVGVGVRAEYEPKLDEGFPFDEDVRAFVSAVLDRSAVVGVRGGITGDYLTRLGFREGSDHTVIGCPSMYALGPELAIRSPRLNKKSTVCVNASQSSPKAVADFTDRVKRDYPDHWFIPQWLEEMRLVYAGVPSVSPDHPVATADDTYLADRVRFFVNVPTWMEFLREADLSVGARLHGNVVATLAGTPSLLIALDARMRELAEYHQLTSVAAGSITTRTKLADLVAAADFQRPVARQGENFDSFLRFLEANGFDHVYAAKPSRAALPFDQMLAKVRHQPPIVPVTSCPPAEMVRRWERYFPLQDERVAQRTKALRETVAAKNRTIAGQRRKLADQEQVLERVQALVDRKRPFWRRAFAVTPTSSCQISPLQMSPKQ